MFDIELDDDEMALIEKLDTGIRGGPRPCLHHTRGPGVTLGDTFTGHVRRFEPDECHWPAPAPSTG